MGDQQESSWWADLGPQWTEDDARHLTDLLVQVYPDQNAIQPFAEAAGFSIPEQPDSSALTEQHDRPARPTVIWRQVLAHAAQHETLENLMASLRDSIYDSESSGELLAALRRITQTPGTLERISGPSKSIEGIAFRALGAVLPNRLAQIRINGRAVGTGVLVGKNLVLTACHVIERQDGEIADCPSIEAAFDFIPQPGITHDETGQALRTKGIICHSHPSESERRNSFDWYDDIPGDKLDYAILELASDAPEVLENDNLLSRGYFTLRFCSYGFTFDEHLLLGHFPRGDTARISLSNFMSTHRTGRRIRYKADTDYGSSGGPVINTEGQLVAIHHFAESKKRHAVPVSEISQDIETKGLAYLFEQPDRGTADRAPVSYLGNYSPAARERTCREIEPDWPRVVEYIALPEFIHDSYSAWDWLRSHNRLGRLRKAIEEAGFIELAEFLDRDAILVDLDSIIYISKLASRLAEAAQAARIARSRNQEILRARSLAWKLQRKIEELPCVSDDNRARLRWREDWQSALNCATYHLDQISNPPQPYSADSRHGSLDIAELGIHTKEIGTATSTMLKLAQHPSLYL